VGRQAPPEGAAPTQRLPAQDLPGIGAGLRCPLSRRPAGRQAGSNRSLAKSISDAGWAAFRTTLAYKAACAGKQVLLVEPAFTSQECSGCGARVQESLSIRTHVCSSCGLVLDRDQNAAKNILRAGQARRGAVGPRAVVKRESIGL